VDLLLDPFAPEFMRRAWLELALLAVPAGVLGTLVVLRRLAFATHALGVGTFPGVVLAVGLGVSPFLGGLAAALVLAGLLTVLTRRLALDPSAVTGILLATALAVGSLLVSDVYVAQARVDALLFGSLIGVDDDDLLVAAVIAALVVAAAAAFRRPWLAAAFDAPHAEVLGARPGRDDAVLLSLLAAAVVASVAAVGSLLVSSLLVVPAATARLVTRRFTVAMGAAAALSLLCSTVGLWISYRIEAPPGATVAATAAVLFAAVLAGRALLRRRSGVRPAAVLAVLTVAVTGCGGSGGGEEGGGAGDGQVAVVATTPIVADWVRRVGGERVTVTRLVDTGADPHDFEPGPREAEAVAEADLLLAMGAGLDDWAGDLGAGADGPLVEVAPVDDLRPAGAAHGSEDEHGGDEADPHFWHDPRLARAAVERVATALAEADPGGADAFRAAASRYGDEIDALDRELADRYGSIPPPRRKLVTNHDAFAYLAHRYGLEVVGTVIPSTSTAAEPNARDTVALIDAIRREGCRRSSPSRRSTRSSVGRSRPRPASASMLTSSVTPSRPRASPEPTT
jgi:ABC-type Mn2+/Zn2+ transport system permease subunit/ABC-type Zn uptake system ZnuABC Zn-binding protein ZnuA